MKEVKFSKEARKAINAGVTILAKAVKTTLGPRGRNVVIEKYHNDPVITKDGVTVARNIEFTDHWKNIGASIVKNAAERTNSIVGDGPQPLYSKVYTPEGYTTIGSLQKGDIICGSNGTLQTVLGIFPKGKKEIYKVKTSDGRVIECCSDHLWTVNTYFGTKKTCSVQELIDSNKICTTDYSGNNKYGYYIPISKIEHSVKDLPIDPYTLGTLIGDGSLSGTGSVELSIGRNKKHIIDKLKFFDGIKLNISFIEKRNYYRIKITGCDKNGKYIKDLLSDLGLYGVHSDTKHIPKEYLYASIEQRQALFQGLLDTDGYINNRGLFEYSTVSKQLFEDILELTRGLGLTVYHRLHTRESDTDSYSDTPIYRIMELKGYKHGLKIISIEPTGEFTDMVCIKVSNPDSLYITNDYVPTHNTTTSIVLVESILQEAEYLLAKGKNPVDLKKGIEKASKLVLDFIDKHSIEVADNMNKVESIATISANNDSKIGAIIRQAIEQVGSGGVLTVEESNTEKTYIKTVDGMELDAGWMFPHFINNPKTAEADFKKPLVIVTNHEISSHNDIVKFLKIANEEGRPLVLFCDELKGTAVNFFMQNIADRRLTGAVVRTPGHVDKQLENMQDMATILGCNYFEKSVHASLAKTDFDGTYIGSCDRIIIGREKTTIVHGHGSEELIQGRIDTVKAQLKEASSEYDKQTLQKRIGKLAGGVGVIYVGSETQFERGEIKDRVEDALNATRAAIEEGIVPGGGTILLKAAEQLKRKFKFDNKEENLGAELLRKAIILPTITIADNAGLNGKRIASKAAKGAVNIGYDARKEKMVDMLKEGVIDPAKVVKTALKNAVSIASTLITTEAVVALEPDNIQLQNVPEI